MYYVAEWVNGWHAIVVHLRTLADARAALDRCQRHNPAARLQVMRDY
jgi:hypothetical protein